MGTVLNDLTDIRLREFDTCVVSIDEEKIVFNPGRTWRIFCGLAHAYIKRERYAPVISAPAVNTVIYYCRIFGIREGLKMNTYPGTEKLPMD